MISKKACTLSVLILVAIISAAPAFGQRSMGGMSDQNMGSMTMDQMSYDVTVAGKNFTVMVGTNGKFPTNMQFNETQKSISFMVSGISSQDFVHYEITIPADLLSGNLTATLGGMPVKSITEVNGSLIAVHITVPSSFVKSNNISDSTILTITSTQTIPEFPVSAPIAMFAAFTVSSLLLIRNNKFNSKF